MEGWTSWTGVNLRRYARRVKTSPPIIVTGDDTGAIERLEQEAEDRIRTYGTNWPDKQHGQQ